MKTSRGRIGLVAFCFPSDVLCGCVLAQQVYFGAGNATRTFASPLANRSLARIRVNILSPGLCATEIWKDIVAAAPSEKECLDYWNANIPGQRLSQHFAELLLPRPAPPELCLHSRRDRHHFVTRFDNAFDERGHLSVWIL